jgi:hypothetical protein
LFVRQFTLLRALLDPYYYMAHRAEIYGEDFDDEEEEEEEEDEEVVRDELDSPTQVFISHADRSM